MMMMKYSQRTIYFYAHIARAPAERLPRTLEGAKDNDVRALRTQDQQGNQQHSYMAEHQQIPHVSDNDCMRI
jgi:hypothetical protein